MLKFALERYFSEYKLIPTIMKLSSKSLGLTFLVAMGMAGGCDDHELPQCDEVGAETHLIEVDQAIERGKAALGDLDGLTRSSSLDMSVIRLGQNTSTRGDNDAETYNGYYLINYGDDGGFAILGADDRLPAVLAYSDEGHLSLEDVEGNEGLASFMNSLVSINRPVVPDTLVPALPFNTNIPLHIYPLSQQKGRLPRAIRAWHSGYPYNREAFHGDTTKHLTQVAISSAQIAAYFRYAGSGCEYDWNKIHNWNPLKSDDDGGTCALLDRFSTQCVEEDYMPDNPWYERYDCWFRSLGYSCLPEEISPAYTTYPYYGSSEDMVEDLRNGYLLQVCGYRIGDTTERDMETTWVIDGYIEYKADMIPVWHLMSSLGQYILIHVAWGKGGKNDGYYIVYNSENYKGNIEGANSWSNSLWGAPTDADEEWDKEMRHFGTIAWYAYKYPAPDDEY